MISSMKKLTLVVLKEDLENVLLELQKFNGVMITKQEESANYHLPFDGDIIRCDQSLKTLSKYEKKSGLFGNYYESSFDSLSKVDLNVESIVSKVDELSQSLNAEKANIAAINEQIKSLEPWMGLKVRLDEIKNTHYTVVHTGYVEQKYLDQFEQLLTCAGSIYSILGQSRSTLAVYFQNFIEDDDELMEQIKNFGFTEFTLPKFEGFLSKEYDDHLNHLIDVSLERIEEIESELTKISNDIPQMKLYVDQLLTKKAREEADFRETTSVYVIEGYIPTDKVDSVKSAIEKATNYYDIELVDPTEDEDVPTHLVNNKFVSPFETITNMFSVPSWKEIDPNPVMSIWYWFLFGMMIGDVGYGIVLLLGTILFIKLLHPNKGTKALAKIFMYSSIPTIFWGILFNSYFGASLPYKAVVSPMNDPMNMLILSVAVGVFHIITGLIMRAIRDVIAKEYMQMIAKDLSWILIILGLTVFCVNMVLPNALIKFTGIGMIVLGVLFILLFSGHKKKNIFAKGIAGLLGLYDATSYMGDLLSYTRIMALVMSSASVAYVMNTLAGMVQGNILGWFFSILIYIAGHTFNLVLGLLSAYVHDCRLQYIEFYGKFYDGGGKEFKPLSTKTKYTNEIKK